MAKQIDTVSDAAADHATGEQGDRGIVQTLLVTGGAGFIGSNFVRLALSRTGARVVVFDSLTYAGSLESLKDVAADPRFAFVHADVTDRGAVAAALAEHR